MATLQKKGDGWYCQFAYQSRRYTFTVGRVSAAEAVAMRSRVDYVLMRLKQGLMELPKGADVVTFVRNDGKVAKAEVIPATYKEFRDAYLKAMGRGAIELNTLDTVKIHLAHVGRTLGEKFPMPSLTLADVQGHIDRRREEVTGITIKKEIDTLRTAWKWSARMGQVHGEFPNTGLTYPKEREKLPFMTWAEIDRRIAAGGDPELLWECLYLTVPEVEEFLTFLKERKAPDWVYPMVFFAAHTGARRSELIRATAEDVDLQNQVVTIREKKRVKGRLTTRRVPLSDSLCTMLRDWVPGRISLFGTGDEARSVQSTQKGLVRAIRGSKWSVMRGYHVLRHSFISAMASRGIDQRLIDEWAGHSTEAMRRRYRHLHPSMQADAIKSVFG